MRVTAIASGVTLPTLPSPKRQAIGKTDPSSKPKDLDRGVIAQHEEELKQTSHILLSTPTFLSSLPYTPPPNTVSNPESAFIFYCPNFTKTGCARANGGMACRDQAHFVPIVKPWTDIALGDCSYLNTCHRIATSCKYLHYDILPPMSPPILSTTSSPPRPDIWSRTEPMYTPRTPLPAQWISADIRKLDFRSLGKFGVVMMDPPWDIHQLLPYGTLTDDETLRMPVETLQEGGGLLLLWVTGRALEVGRQAMQSWGYRRVDEVVWVKVNQLGRCIRTGRTGHWLNHSKEHLLVGVRLPSSSRPHEAFDTMGISAHWRPLHADVLVSEVRETSRKPDEIYPIIDRLVGPNVRKLEIFGREGNLRPGWITVGNQLKGSRILEREVGERVGVEVEGSS
ncbi:hypothetical protein YB2330_006082 [Saitoella coloradoensis]